MFKRRKPDEPPAAAALPERDRIAPKGPYETPAGEPAPPLGIPAVPAAAALSPPPLNQIKESMPMSRPPLTPTPMPPQNSPMPSARAQLQPPRMAHVGGDRRTLVVGRGISVKGTIQDAERLVVEGTVEAESLTAAELQIALGGVLKGSVEVEDAEISGLMDGMLTVRGSLVLRGSGQITGEARCRRLQVEDGGQLSGKISMIVGEAPVAVVAEAAG